MCHLKQYPGVNRCRSSCHSTGGNSSSVRNIADFVSISGGGGRSDGGTVVTSKTSERQHEYTANHRLQLNTSNVFNHRHDNNTKQRSTVCGPPSPNDRMEWCRKVVDRSATFDHFEGGVSRMITMIWMNMICN